MPKVGILYSILVYFYTSHLDLFYFLLIYLITFKKIRNNLFGRKYRDVMVQDKGYACILLSRVEFEIGKSKKEWMT